jgi:hypothetical protein
VYLMLSMSVAVKRVLMDVLKPRELSIVELAKALGAVDEKGEVEIIVSEVDSKTETLKVTIRGANIDYMLVSKIMDQYGVSIRGIDEINVARE